MKYKIYIFLVFILFFCYKSVHPIEYLPQSFYLDEEISVNYDELYEVGVKIEYYTSDKAIDEIDRLNRRLLKDYKMVCLNSSENSLEFSNGNRSIYVFGYDKEKESKIEIEVISRNKEKLCDLMEVLTHLQNNNKNKARYFQYIKGKINNVESTIKSIKNNTRLENIEILDIYNGYVGTAEYNKYNKISFAINNYDTGCYLIIGTPAIFTTY